MTGTDIEGFCDPKFSRLRNVFEDNFRRGLEIGASLAVTLDGETVVDLWGGYTNAETKRPWQHDTITLVASSTKIPTSLCALMLIDQGKLDIERSVASYWPEFAANGKGKVLVRHLFEHSAGLPAFSPPVPHALIYDWTAATAALAAAELWWEPGTQCAYHSRTFGFLIGEVIRRISGKTPGVFLRDEVTARIGADFQIGMAPTEIRRMARIVVEPEPLPEPDSIAFRIETEFLPPMWDGIASLTSENPGANGVGNARALARIGAVFAMNGTLAGYRFLSPATMDRVVTELSYRLDAYVGEPVRWGLGLGLHSKEFPCCGEGSVHWGGAGGSFMVADRDCRASIGYVMNRFAAGFGADPRGEPLRRMFIEIMRG